jgi:copper oxidase (laccase) domain-containing protein
VAGIAGQTLSVMTAAFGVQARDVHVALGPAIGACCYDVGDDVIDAWRRTAGAESAAALSCQNGRSHFGLAAANRLLLTRVGVRSDHIEDAPVCTRCDGERWFSHRGQGAATGRFGAMIAVSV